MLRSQICPGKILPIVFSFPFALTCQSWWQLFSQYGEPLFPVESRRAVGRPRLLTADDDAVLLNLLLHDASLYLDELADQLSVLFDKCVSVHHVLSSMRVRHEYYLIWLVFFESVVSVILAWISFCPASECDSQATVIRLGRTTR